MRCSNLLDKHHADRESEDRESFGKRDEQQAADKQFRFLGCRPKGRASHPAHRVPRTEDTDAHGEGRRRRNSDGPPGIL
jgi:hypothetical protein